MEILFLVNLYMGIYTNQIFLSATVRVKVAQPAAIANIAQEVAITVPKAMSRMSHYMHIERNKTSY